MKRALKTRQRYLLSNLKIGEIVQLNVSQNGTVMTSIECSKYQYKLHTYEGIAELFVSCGQILSILAARNRIQIKCSSSSN